MVKSGSSVPNYVAVTIPTASEFLVQWHDWVAWKISKHFKRNQERIPDTAQRARLRLLQKEFVSRWFFKHLRNDLVDLAQASEILDGAKIKFIGSIQPVFGDRSSENSLWRIQDLLDYAKFDYERYFYSPQGHTIDSNKFLRLLGYGTRDPNTGIWKISPSDYGVLESLYRQGRVKPAELTEHDCTEVFVDGECRDRCSIPGCVKEHFSRGYCSTHYHVAKVHTCQDCEDGREALSKAGISLNKRWTTIEVAIIISKLRWNDKQLIPFLRKWKRKNIIKGPPKYIMRPPSDATIEAGLKQYAYLIIHNDMVNTMKGITKSDELVCDGRLDPESQNEEIIGWDSSGESEDHPTRIIIDQTASENFRNCDRRFDLMKIIKKAHLSDEESRFIEQVDISEVPATDVAMAYNIPVSRVHRIRSMAISKMKYAADSIGISEIL